MKQFQCTSASSGRTRGPIPEELAMREVSTAKACETLGKLLVGQYMVDGLGDYWTRLPDLALQDDVPLTGDDVAVGRASALNLHARLRLERIATAALQGLLAGSTANVVLMSELNKSGIDPFPRLASDAHLAAKALIAELDKQS